MFWYNKGPFNFVLNSRFLILILKALYYLHFFTYRNNPQNLLHNCQRTFLYRYQYKINMFFSILNGPLGTISIWTPHFTYTRGHFYLATIWNLQQWKKIEIYKFQPKIYFDTGILQQTFAGQSLFFDKFYQHFYEGFVSWL